MVSGARKAAVGLSGGTDSAMAAYLLLEAGWTVLGITLDLWPASGNDTGNGPPVGRAARVAAELGIEHVVVPARAAFERAVVTPFVKAYCAGLTPSPCVLCNAAIKFGLLWDVAGEHGCSVMATGHYARVDVTAAGVFPRLLRGRDPVKDQSYFLAMLSPAQLRRSVFPLGDAFKTEVRGRALALGLAAPTERESQDLCFVPRGNYAEFVERRCPQRALPGPIVTTRGEMLGQHAGIHRYTIGQRKGLGLGGGPWYVTGLNPATNTVIVGRHDDLLAHTVDLHGVNWLVPPPDDTTRLTYAAQLRYTMAPRPCAVRRVGNDAACLRFEQPVAAVTPGQLAVVYDGDRVLGGGWITGPDAASRGQVRPETRGQRRGDAPR